MPDVLTVMFDELRAAQPTEESEFMEWLTSIAQVIAAYPTDIRRGACVPLYLCIQSVVREVERAKGVAR